VRVAVLRISGSQFVPHEWLDRHGIVADAVWQAGEPRGDRVPTESGLNLRIADGEEIPRLVCGWVEARTDAIRSARTLGASVVIDVGVTVGTADQFTAAVCWSPSELATLAASGVDLCVSAYPATDDEDPVGTEAPDQSLLHVALVVRDYDEAIAWYCGTLGFRLVEDTYQPEQDKRWVVVSPAGSVGTSLLLARAATPEQGAFVGNQSGGRVFLFLQTDDVWRDHERLTAAGVRFVRAPKTEPYGTVAVFEDLYGNKWDLIETSRQDDGI
jgi:catechol 2,3-dioxygenase-like lactoylglutathione lyase family enzyme